MCRPMIDQWRDKLQTKAANNARRQKLVIAWSSDNSRVQLRFGFYANIRHYSIIVSINNNNNNNNNTKMYKLRPMSN